MPPLLVVRADATPATGAGHLIRSIALAQAWRDRDGDAVVVTATDRLPRELKQGEFDVLRLNASHPSAEDAERVIGAARGRPASWVCVDGRQFDGDYVVRLRRAGCRVLAIDDVGGPASMAADVVLDQNVDARPSLYARARGKVLLGTRYALLRRVFRQRTAHRRAFGHRAEEILVMFGSSDPLGQTRRVMRTIQSIDHVNARTTVIVGPHVRDAASVRDLARSSAKGGFVLREDPSDLPDLMAASDLAISAAGSTCWELSLLGTPMILITVAADQEGIARGLAAAGAAISLGSAAGLTDAALRSTIVSVMESESIRRSQSEAARGLVDGLGADRVVAELRGFAVRR